MGKFWPQNVATNCLYLFAWVSLCVLLILFFKPSFCNGPETELKWKTDIENLYNICILSYTDSWCLVRFSSNISCDRKHNVRLCCDHRGNRFVYQSPNKQFFSSEWSHKQNSCNSNAYRSEWGFGREFVNEVAWVNVSWEGNQMKQSLSIKKKDIQLFQRVQTG